MKIILFIPATIMYMIIGLLLLIPILNIFVMKWLGEIFNEN